MLRISMKVTLLLALLPAAVVGELVDGVVHYKLEEQFKPMLKKLETITSKTYQGLPLSEVAPFSREGVLKHLAHALDVEKNPDAAISQVEIDDTGPVCNSEFDWLRGDRRVLLRTTSLEYKGIKGGWRIYLCDLHVNKKEPTYDELWIAIYTPRGIYVYEHDLVSALKKDKERASSYIKMTAPPHVSDWKRALDELLLPQFKNCKRIAHVPFDDERFKTALSSHDPRMILGQGAFDGVPLRAQGDYELDQMMQTMARAVEKLRYPASRLEVRNADAGRDFDWQRVVIETDLRHDRKSPPLGLTKVSSRTCTMTFDHQKNAWRLHFIDIKLPSAGVKGRVETPFDELYISFFTPRGVYVYKHDMELGVHMQAMEKSKKPGQKTMYESSIYASEGVLGWKRALDNDILPTLDATCQLLGLIDFGVEASLVDPYADARRALHALPAGAAMGAASPAGACSAQRAQCELDDDSDEWIGAWLGRFEDWWILTPYRDGLKACMGALGVHLASRLELFRRAAFSNGGPPAAAGAQPAAEGECDWVSDYAETGELNLPDFPSIDNMRFELLPPIPRLLPSTERLLSLESTPTHSRGPAEQTGGQSQSSSRQSGYSTWVGAGAGAGAALLAMVAFAGLRSACRREGRLALARATPASK